MDKFLLGVLTGVVGIAVAAVISDRLDYDYQDISYKDEEPVSESEEKAGDKEETARNEDTKKPEGDEKRYPSILGEAIGMLLRDAK